MKTLKYRGLHPPTPLNLYCSALSNIVRIRPSSELLYIALHLLSNAEKVSKVRSLA
jgi:hypothetical protein